MTDALPWVVDVEASGFGRGGYPIEIGLADPYGHTANHLIRPEPDWSHWSDDAERVHGIARHTLVEYGLPVGAVATWLNDVLRGQVVYCDAWGFDVAWIARLFDAAERFQRFRIESIFTLLDEAQSDAWARMCEEVALEQDLTRHRASGDARIQQIVYARLKGIDAGGH